MDNRAVVTVTLSNEDLVYCQGYAERIVDYHNQLQTNSAYDHNEVPSNVVGVKGKLALVRWMETFIETSHIKQPFRVYTRQEKPCDISYGLHFLKVKCVQPEGWIRTGRMVTLKHLPGYLDYGVIVVWGTPCEDETVFLRGWNYAWEIQDYGIPWRIRADNKWLKDENSIHSMDSLYKMLKTTQTEMEINNDMISIFENHRRTGRWQ